jgi:hypothetical protein
MTCQSRVHVGNYGDDLRGRSSGTLGALGHHRPFGVFDFARPTGDFPSKCIEGLPLNSGAFDRRALSADGYRLAPNSSGSARWPCVIDYLAASARPSRR